MSQTLLDDPERALDDLLRRPIPDFPSKVIRAQMVMSSTVAMSVYSLHESIVTPPNEYSQAVSSEMQEELPSLPERGEEVDYHVFDHKAVTYEIPLEEDEYALDEEALKYVDMLCTIKKDTVRTPIRAPSPKKKGVPKTQPKQTSKGQRRPRVLPQYTQIIKSATETDYTNMLMPRSPKILPVENAKNEENKVIYERELTTKGMYFLYDRIRTPHPIRVKYQIEDRNLCDRLNRKATDHFNRLKFAWNLAECDKLRGILEGKGI